LSDNIQNKGTINVSFCLDFLLILNLRYSRDFFDLCRRLNDFRDFLRSFFNDWFINGIFSPGCGFYGSNYLFDDLSF
jgi:hypothetical protein